MDVPSLMDMRMPGPSNSSRRIRDHGEEALAADVRNKIIRERISLTLFKFGRLMSKYGVPVPDCPTFLQCCPEYFYFGDDDIVYPWTRLRVCKDYNNIDHGCDFPYCERLHLCERFIVWNDCPQLEGECRFGHELDQSCCELLRIHRFNGVTLDDIRCLFQLVETRTAEVKRMSQQGRNESYNSRFKASQLRKLLLEAGGEATLEGLRNLALSAKLELWNVETFIEQNYEYFQRDSNGNVIAWTAIRICRNHLYDAGGCMTDVCEFLHICKRFLVKGDCRFDTDTCRYGHTLNEMRLLEQHSLMEMSMQDIRLLFQLVYKEVIPANTRVIHKSTAEVAEDLRKTVLTQGGKASLDGFKVLMTKAGVTDTSPEKYLDEHRGHFRLQKNSQVVAWTTLRVCQEYLEGCCDHISCRGLHVCMKHLTENCTNCLLCHNVFDTGHNLDLLKQHNLDKLRLPEVRQLFRIIYEMTEQTKLKHLEDLKNEAALVKKIRKRIIVEGEEMCENKLRGIIQELGGNVHNLKTFVNKYPSYLRYQIKSVSKDTKALPKIMAWTDLRVCKDYTTDAGCKVESCRRIHICKFHLFMGDCRFGDNCYESHDVKSKHNVELLRFYELDELSLEELRVLFQTVRNRQFEGKSSKILDGYKKKANNLRKLLLEEEDSVSATSFKSCASKIGIEEQEAKKLAEKQNEFFSMDRDGNPIPWTNLRLCKNYSHNEEGCPSKQCPCLHLCHYLLTTGCRHENSETECSKSHDVKKGSKNYRLLQMYHLEDLPPLLLKKLYSIIDSKIKKRNMKKVITTDTEKWMKLRGKMLDTGGSMPHKEYQLLCEQLEFRAAATINPDYVHCFEENVLAWTTLRVCGRHMYGEKQCHVKSCCGLHICKHFLIGDCHFEDTPHSCRFGHDISEGSDNNKRLERFHLHELSTDKLKTLFRLVYRTVKQKTDSTKVKKEDRNALLEGGEKVSKEIVAECAKKGNDDPLKVCKEKGCTSSSCPTLHICKDFLSGKCQVENCKNGHTLDKDARNAEILKKHGLQDSTLSSLKKILPVSDKTVTERPNKSAGPAKKKVTASEKKNLNVSIAVAVRKQMLGQGGKVSFRAFQKMLVESKISKEESNKFIDEHKDYFIKSDDTVVSFTRLKFCDAFRFGESGCSVEKCNGLHACRHWLVKDDCRGGEVACRLGHTLSDDGNKNLLQQHHLDDLSVPLIRQLLQVRAETAQKRDLERPKRTTISIELLTANDGSRVPYQEFIGHQGCNILYIENMTNTGLKLGNCGPENPPSQITVTYSSTADGREARKLLQELVDRVNEDTARHNEMHDGRSGCSSENAEGLSSEESEQDDVGFMRTLLLNEDMMANTSCKPEIYCALCFIHLPNPRVYRIHLKGPLHKAKLNSNKEKFDISDLQTGSPKSSSEHKKDKSSSQRSRDPRQHVRSLKDPSGKGSDVGGSRRSSCDSLASSHSGKHNDQEILKLKSGSAVNSPSGHDDGSEDDKEKKNNKPFEGISGQQQCKGVSMCRQSSYKSPNEVSVKTPTPEVTPSGSPQIQEALKTNEMLGLCLQAMIDEKSKMLAVECTTDILLEEKAGKSPAASIGLKTNRNKSTEGTPRVQSVHAQVTKSYSEGKPVITASYSAKNATASTVELQAKSNQSAEALQTDKSCTKAKAVVAMSDTAARHNVTGPKTIRQKPIKGPQTDKTSCAEVKTSCVQTQPKVTTTAETTCIKHRGSKSTEDLNTDKSGNIQVKKSTSHIAPRANTTGLKANNKKSNDEHQKKASSGSRESEGSKSAPSLQELQKKPQVKTQSSSKVKDLKTVSDAGKSKHKSHESASKSSKIKHEVKSHSSNKTAVKTEFASAPAITESNKSETHKGAVKIQSSKKSIDKEPKGTPVPTDVELKKSESHKAAVKSQSSSKTISKEPEVGTTPTNIESEKCESHKGAINTEPKVRPSATNVESKESQSHEGAVDNQSKVTAVFTNVELRKSKSHDAHSKDDTAVTKSSNKPLRDLSAPDDNSNEMIGPKSSEATKDADVAVAAAAAEDSKVDADHDDGVLSESDCASDSEWFAALVSSKTMEDIQLESEKEIPSNIENKDFYASKATTKGQAANKKSPRKRNKIWNVLPDALNYNPEQSDQILEAKQHKKRKNESHSQSKKHKHKKDGHDASKKDKGESRKGHSKYRSKSEKDATGRQHSRKRKRNERTESSYCAQVDDDVPEQIEDASNVDEDKAAGWEDIQMVTSKVFDTLIGHNKQQSTDKIQVSQNDQDAEKDINEAIDGFELDAERQMAQKRRRAVYDILMQAQHLKVALAGGEQPEDGEPDSEAKERMRLNQERKLRMKQKIKKWKENLKINKYQKDCKASNEVSSSIESSLADDLTLSTTADEVMHATKADNDEHTIGKEPTLSAELTAAPMDYFNTGDEIVRSESPEDGELTSGSEISEPFSIVNTGSSEVQAESKKVSQETTQRFDNKNGKKGIRIKQSPKDRWQSKQIDQANTAADSSQDDLSICRSYDDLRKKLDRQIKPNFEQNQNLQIDVTGAAAPRKVSVSPGESGTIKDKSNMESVKVIEIADGDKKKIAAIEQKRKFLMAQLNNLDTTLHKLKKKQVAVIPEEDCADGEKLIKSRLQNAEKRRRSKAQVLAELNRVDKQLKKMNRLSPNEGDLLKEDAKEKDVKGKKQLLCRIAKVIHKKYLGMRETSVMRELGKKSAEKKSTILTDCNDANENPEPSSKKQKLSPAKSSSNEITSRQSSWKRAALEKEDIANNPSTGAWEEQKVNQRLRSPSSSYNCYRQTRSNSGGSNRSRSRGRRSRSRSRSPRSRYHRYRSPVYGRYSRSRSRSPTRHRRNRHQSPYGRHRRTKVRHSRSHSSERHRDTVRLTPEEQSPPGVGDAFGRNELDPVSKNVGKIQLRVEDMDPKVTAGKTQKKSMTTAPIVMDDLVDLEDSSREDSKTKSSVKLDRISGQVTAVLVEMFGDIFALQIHEKNFSKLETEIEKTNMILVTANVRKTVPGQSKVYLEAAAQDLMSLSGQRLNFICSTCQNIKYANLSAWRSHLKSSAHASRCVWKMLKLGPAKYKEEFSMIPTPRPSEIHKALETMMINVQMRDTLIPTFEKFLRMAKPVASSPKATKPTSGPEPSSSTSHQSAHSSATNYNSIPVHPGPSMPSSAGAPAYPPYSHHPWVKYPTWHLQHQPNYSSYPYYPGPPVYTNPGHLPPPLPHQPPPSGAPGGT